MTNSDDLADLRAEIRDLKRQIRELQTSTAQQSMSITQGRMRFIGGLLRVDSGGRVEIVGTLEIEGATTVTGTFTVEGPWSLDGNGNITGAVGLTGDMTVTGDVIVTGAGRVKVGNLTLDPSTNGGSIKFGGGPEVYAAGALLALYSGLGAFIELDGTMAKINGPGARWLEVNSTGFKLVNLPTKTAASTGLPAGVLHADSSGYLFRIV